MTEPVVPKRLTPILQNEKGYFTIGPEKEATHMFLFNVFICFGSYIQEAFPKDLKVQDNDTCQFVYDLFGTQITSKPFYWYSEPLSFVFQKCPLFGFIFPGNEK